jgi:hypothetical protein
MGVGFAFVSNPLTGVFVMANSRKQPPSERDFKLYRLLVIEGATVNDAAELFHISETRVRQVQRRVLDWAAEVLPPETPVTTENLLRVTQITASERLEQLYADAVIQWRYTSEPRYLNLALRAVQMEVKLQLPSRAGTLEGALERMDAAADAVDWPPDEHERVEHGAPAASNAAGASIAAAAAAPVRKESWQVRAEVKTPSVEDCGAPIKSRRGFADPPLSPAGASRPKAGKLEGLLADDPFWKAEQQERVRTLLKPAKDAGGG